MTAEGPQIPGYNPCDFMAAIVSHPCHDAALEVFDRSQRGPEADTEMGRAADTVAVALGEMSMTTQYGPTRPVVAEYARDALNEFRRVCMRQTAAMSIQAACADCPNKLKV